MSLRLRGRVRTREVAADRVDAGLRASASSSDADIARAVGVSREYVRQRRARAGLPPSRWGRNRHEDTRARVLAAHRADPTLSATSLAARLELSASTVFEHARAAGLQIRFKDARQPSPGDYWWQREADTFSWSWCNRCIGKVTARTSIATTRGRARAALGSAVVPRSPSSTRCPRCLDSRGHAAR